MSRNKSLMVAELSPPVRNSIFGPAPILESENPKAYGELFEGVSRLVTPCDIFEDVWCRELVDLIWEIRRYQEYRTLALKAAMPKALAEILAPLVDGPRKYGAIAVYDVDGGLKPTPSMEIANDWLCGRPAGTKRVNDALRDANLTMKDVEARAMTLVFDKIDRT